MVVWQSTELLTLGDLSGSQVLLRLGNLEVLPYILPGVTQINENDAGLETEGKFKMGVDMKYGITSNLTADVTFNTDFAQVEADEEQVNLTRFSLFFPEKASVLFGGCRTFRFWNTADQFPSPTTNAPFL